MITTLKNSKWKKDSEINVTEFPMVETLDVDEESYDKFISKFSREKVIKKSKNKKKKTKTQIENNNTEKCEEIENKESKNLWLNYGVPEEISEVLIKNNLIKPTEIQDKCLTEMMKLRKDSVVAAETGSGKTLLYILPILAKCLEIRKFTETPEPKLRCLIIAPTRELAVQVKNMFMKISKPFGVFCVEIIGGISDIKQDRILSKRPEIIVGTPGRLWSFFESYHEHFNDLSGLKLLVIDEVDRMTEKGHFNQLLKIITTITEKSQNFIKFVLSATLNSKSFSLNDSNFTQKILNLRNFSVFDLSSSHKTPASLEEFKVFCDEKKLNLFLYLVLLKSGKTIIFVPTIKICNWLGIFLKILNITVLKLNSGMSQKNRLLLFEKFNENNGVLLATDVAARGLDFPDVDTILHYSVPTTPETYVHRSGRSARQLKKGRSILLVTPDGLTAYKKIIEHLARSEDLSEFDVDYKAQVKLQPIIDACSKLTEKCFKLQKTESNNRWFKEKAKASETMIDSDFVKSYDPELEKNPSLKKEILRETKIIQRELTIAKYNLDL